MSRARTGYRCQECGTTAVKWVGRCPGCSAWGTLAEEVSAAVAGLAAVPAGAVSVPARPIATVDIEAARAQPTGVPELDRVLGGGLVPGAVLLLAGEPGIGKSTLLLDVADKYAASGRRALIVTGEESAAQVRLRAERTGALDDELFLAAETDLAAVLSHVDAVRPGLLVVDSVQTVTSPVVDGAAGGVTQVRAVAAALIAAAKERGIATVMVGHVTKDGSIAGPRVLEHLVDVVLQFEGERHSTLRMVRAVKNRYGPADEIGCFELRDEGIVGLPDSSGLFLTPREMPVPGTCVTVTLEGRRPLLAEVQALVAPTGLPHARRAVSGLDSSRVAMVLAVLERRGRLTLAHSDVFAATVGGVRLSEPAADLALALAVASGVRDRAVPTGWLAIGEVGLAGDVRHVQGGQRRLAEAARLGFTHALAPAGSGRPPDGLQVVEVEDLFSALLALSLLPA